MASLTEKHGYGHSLGCIPRKLFVLAFAVVAAGLCWLQVLHWLVVSSFFREMAGYPDPHKQGCVGSHCFEVWSCLGMQEVTLRLREPLVSLSGAVLLTVGVFGALRARAEQLNYLYLYLAASAGLHFVLMVVDGVYLGACGAYPQNMVEQVLLPSWRLPPSLISVVAREKLSKLTYFSVSDVDAATGGFNAAAWYYAICVITTVALGYAALETAALAPKIERGPLGLGVHYGLNQWEQAEDRDALRRRRWRNKHSSFIEDTVEPVRWHGENGFPVAKEWPHLSYGGPDQGTVDDRAWGFGDEDEEGDEEAPLLQQAINEAAFAGAVAAAEAAAGQAEPEEA